METPRAVRIIESPDSWNVVFVTRKARGWRQAACFAKDMRSRERVAAWIAERPEMRLVD